MTTLTHLSKLTDPGTSEGDFQEGLGALYGVVTELLGASGEEALTISAGLVTPTKALISIDSEGSAASDDLSNISPTNHPNGRLVLLRAVNASRVVTVKHLSGGSGQVSLTGAVDAVLDDTSKTLLLRYQSSGDKWVEVLRSWGSYATLAQGAKADTAVQKDGSVPLTGPLVFEGSTDDAYETSLTVTDPTADRTITLPDASGTLALTERLQTWSAPQRGSVTSDNDLSFDLSVTNNFSCTPTAGGALTFTNHASGHSGFVLLDNSAGVAITAVATTKIHADDLAAINEIGVYLLAYYDNGTNAYVTVSRSFA